MQPETFLAQSFLAQARAIAAEIIGWRRAIHRQPELGFEEFHTARLIAETLESHNIQTRRGIGGTGVAASIGSGRPAIGLRADMDALPIQEENPLDYASTVPGVMHACGHDAHVAMALGAAILLLQNPPLPGTGEVRLLFQPSEERAGKDGKGGAASLIEAGALDGLDAVIALHVNSTLPTGQVSAIPGYAMASGNYFTAVITGKGGHDAMVHQAVDPIFIAAQVINAVYGIRARRLDPRALGTITIGAIQGGASGNIIPGEVHLSGTLRFFEDEQRQRALDELEKAFSIARALGGDYRLDIKVSVPSVYNDPQITQFFKDCAVDLLGRPALSTNEQPVFGVDDFALLSRKVPAAYMMLGAAPEGEERPQHHNPKFDIDESVLAAGAALLAYTATRFLQTNQKPLGEQEKPQL